MRASDHGPGLDGLLVAGVSRVPALQPSPPPPRPRRELAHPLDADLSAVAVARHLTRGMLQAWELEGLVDEVTLVATELVTNALRHGLGLGEVPGEPLPGAPRLRSVDGPANAPASLRRLRSPAPGRATFSLTLTSTSLMCAVSDPSLSPPVMREAGQGSGSGWGLHLVTSLATSWGWAALVESGTTTGKVVWALFDLPEPAAELVPPVVTYSHGERSGEFDGGTSRCGFAAIPGGATPSSPRWPRSADPG